MSGTPAAPLTGDLLAAKGRATAQGFKPTLAAAAPSPVPGPSSVAGPRAVPCASPGASPGPTPVLAIGRAGGGGGGDANRRIKSTIRLDPDRHRRLKLLSAHLGKSGLDILIEALDLYMDRLGNERGAGACHCLFALQGQQPDRP